MKPPPKKACHICGESKPVTSYYRSKDQYGDGSINWCKSCILMYHQMRKEKIKKNRFVEPPIPKEGFKVVFD
jgi:hypothetical protein